MIGGAGLWEKTKVVITRVGVESLHSVRSRRQSPRGVSPGPMVSTWTSDTMLGHNIATSLTRQFL